MGFDSSIRPAADAASHFLHPAASAFHDVYLTGLVTPNPHPARS